MPVIPTFVSSQPIEQRLTTPQMSPEAAAAVPNAQAGLLLGVARAANSFGAEIDRLEERRKAAERASALIAAQAQHSMGLADMQAGFRNDSDPSTMRDRFEAGRQTLRRGIAAGISDEQARAQYLARAERADAAALPRVIEAQARRTGDVGRAGLMQSIESLGGLARAAPDGSSRAEAVSGIAESIAAAVEGGIIGADAGERLRQSTIRQIEQDRARAAVRNGARPRRVSDAGGLATAASFEDTGGFATIEIGEDDAIPLTEEEAADLDAYADETARMAGEMQADLDAAERSRAATAERAEVDGAMQRFYDGVLGERTEPRTAEDILPERELLEEYRGILSPEEFDAARRALETPLASSDPEALASMDVTAPRESLVRDAARAAAAGRIGPADHQRIMRLNALANADTPQGRIYRDGRRGLADAVSGWGRSLEAALPGMADEARRDVEARWDAWVEANPEATQREASEVVRGFVEGARGAVRVRAADRLGSPYGLGDMRDGLQAEDIDGAEEMLLADLEAGTVGMEEAAREARRLEAWRWMLGEEP